MALSQYGTYLLATPGSGFWQHKAQAARLLWLAAIGHPLWVPVERTARCKLNKGTTDHCDTLIVDLETFRTYIYIYMYACNDTHKWCGLCELLRTTFPMNRLRKSLLQLPDLSAHKFPERAARS